ncbi:MAG: hypothetical protein KGZ58_00550 [Ignavibacteriales bacterium]|nr:hypothetical protein [Ignavibacteriales bacterium]
MKLKLIPAFLLFTVYFSASLFADPQKQTRDSVLLKNLREEVSLSQRLIKQLKGDKTKLTKEVKRLKESLKSLTASKDQLEDSLENEIQIRYDTLDAKENHILTLLTFLQMKRDTIEQLCADTMNYGIRFRDVVTLSKQKDDWTQKQTEAVEEHRKTIETLRATFTEMENFLKEQNSALRHELDSLKIFIQLTIPKDSTQKNISVPPK